MKKVEDINFNETISIIKSYYARHGRNWNDLVYFPKIVEGKLKGFEVYKKEVHNNEHFVEM